MSAGFDRLDATPAFVCRAFYQAHVDRLIVERAQSVPVGRRLARSTDELEKDDALLEQSIALLTFSFAACTALPWLFAETEEERSRIVSDPATATHNLTGESVWLTRQLVLLSIYRRAHVFQLLEEHERSYNDLRKVQRICRRTRFGLNVRDQRRANLNTIEALAEFRIGECTEPTTTPPKRSFIFAEPTIWLLRASTPSASAPRALSSRYTSASVRARRSSRGAR